MQQKVELFPKLIVLGVSVTAVIMIWMFVGPMLFKFLSQKLNSSTKKKSVDMDVLIRRKEQMLRGNSPTGQLIPTDKKKNERRGKISRAEQQYRDQFQKLSQNSKKSSDEKNTITRYQKYYGRL